ncbi:T9SS type A sorting domain-containing protein, partial [Candidatus Saganbacteria bacterium]|nr:T9SS type A sorting domain-containing protein [Candidatus Saganbacteria bacterium]
AVIVDNISPEVAVTYPADGAAINGKITIIGKATDQYLDHYILEYGAGVSPESFKNIEPQDKTTPGYAYYTPVDGGVLGTWETAGLSGAYFLRLTAYDKVGNASTESVALNLSGGRVSNKEVRAQDGLPPTFALPNPFGPSIASTTSFVYNLQGNFDTTIYLFDMNGNVIWRKSYAAGENGGKAGANNPSWDGRDLYGSAVLNGVYIYQIAAEHKIIARGKLIVVK